MSATTTTTDAAPGPEVVEIGPGLRAHVYTHTLPTAAGLQGAWTWLSEGLLGCGQAEVMLTLVRRQSEPPSPPPVEPLRVLEVIGALARDGHPVDAGGTTGFREPGFLPPGRMQALLYVDAQPVPGLELDGAALDGRLQLVALTLEELEALRAWGPARVLGRLGLGARHWPHPPWIDRTRPSVADAAADQASVLGRLPRCRVPGMSVVRVGSELRVRLGPEAAVRWAALEPELARSPAVALLTDLAPDADACLVWRPGQTAPAAIGPTGSAKERLGGAFLALVPGQPLDGGMLVEDGFLMRLTAESWQLLLETTGRGEGLRIEGGVEGSSEGEGGGEEGGGGGSAGRLSLVWQAG